MEQLTAILKKIPGRPRDVWIIDKIEFAEFQEGGDLTDE